MSGGETGLTPGTTAPRRGRFRLGLAWKIGIGLGALLLASLLAMGSAIYHYSRTLAVAERLVMARESLDQNAVDIERGVLSARRDLLVLREMPPVQGIIRARDNGGGDPELRDGTEIWRLRMEQIFEAFLMNNPEYLRVRYLDERGDEMVRVDARGGGIAFVRGAGLRNRSRYPCFSEAVKLGRKEIYSSDVNLDREDGRILEPQRPVFRLAVPVHDARDRVRGVIAIDLDARTLFAVASSSKAGLTKFVINQDGYFISHPDRSRELGFDLGFAYTIRDVHPEIAAQLPSRAADAVIHRKHNHIVAYRTIRFDPRDAKRFWAVVLEQPESVAFASINEARDRMVVIGLFIVVSSLVAIQVIARRMVVSPLGILARTANRLAGGDHTVRVPDERIVGDEIGDLAVAFNSMASSIEVEIAERRRVAETLRDQKRESELILHSIGEGIYGLDKAGKATFINPVAARMLGWETGELLGRTVHDVMHHTRPDGTPYPVTECPIYASVEDRKIHYMAEEVFWRKDGTSFPVEYTSTPILDENDGVVGAVVVFSDSTGRKQAEDVIRASLAETERLSARNAALLESARAALKHPEFAAAAREIFNYCKNMIGAESGYIALLSGDGTHNEVLHLDPGWSSCTVDPALPMPIRGLREIAYRLQKPVYDNKYPESSWAGLLPAGHLRLGNVLFAPLLIDGAPAGLFGFGNKAGGFTDTDALIASDFSEIAVLAFVKDRAERELKLRVSELLSLSDASNVVLEATEERYYEKICRAAVESFGLSMAWLGFVKADSCEVVPAAWSGHEAGYLISERFAYDDSPTGMGPTGRAVKTGLPQITNDMETDVAFAPWREEAARRGYRSSLAAPLVNAEGVVTGVLNFYSGEPSFFTSERIRLFAIFANQVGSAVELRRTIDNLEEIVAIRTADLTRARRAAEAANRAKSDFLANMSHELRTPLNAIIGFSEIMREGMAGPLAENQRDFLRDIWESGKHLLRLINDILDISKIEAGKTALELGEFSLNEVLKSCAFMLKEKALKHGIALDLEVSDKVDFIIADQIKIKQVVLNLLSNAMKFTPDGGRVGISARRGEGCWLVTIWDTGIGIAEQDLSRLFLPFQQLEASATKKYEGTGLGLHLSRKFVEAHGGKIWVESAPGQGSRFSFTIPDRPSAERPSLET